MAASSVLHEGESSPHLQNELLVIATDFATLANSTNVSPLAAINYNANSARRVLKREGPLLALRVILFFNQGRQCLSNYKLLGETF